MTTPEPAEAPATVTAVAGWLGVDPINDTENPEMVHIRSVVPAVNALVAEWHTPPAEGDAWPERLRLGAVMLSATLTRRRNSPAGVETFTELGPAYVQRVDPHAYMLLGLGGWRQLVVG